jgi:hypothetical protein
MSVCRFSTPIVSALLMSILTIGAEAALFHPASFPATTAFNSAAGVYEINTDSLQMSGPGGFSSPGVLSNGAAVFSFTNFLLGNGATITTTGDRPAAILSQSDMIIAGGGVIARAAGGAGGAPAQKGTGTGGGFPGSGFFGGAGGGGGYGGPGGQGQLDGFITPGAGGPAYGDISTFFLGGSGGGGSAIGNSTAGNSFGGAGGGAIELGAVDFMLIAGNGVLVEGVTGGGTGFEAGGGGSGGGIRLHADTIINTTTISAAGGRGGVGTFENGGGGGGGRILINFGSGGFLDLGTTTARGGFGGSSFFGSGTRGADGVVTIVPEPATASYLVTGLAAALAPIARLRRLGA